MENKKRIELHTTHTMFTFGLAWGGARDGGNKHIAIIIGCLVIQFNLK